MWLKTGYYYRGDYCLQVRVRCFLFLVKKNAFSNRHFYINVDNYLINEDVLFSSVLFYILSPIKIILRRYKHKLLLELI